MAYRIGQLDMEEVYNEYFSPVCNDVFYKLLNRENTVSAVMARARQKLRGILADEI